MNDRSMMDGLQEKRRGKITIAELTKAPGNMQVTNDIPLYTNARLSEPD